jgi:tetratricopeptide (TPR) repeat protein
MKSYTMGLTGMALALILAGCSGETSGADDPSSSADDMARARCAAAFTPGSATNLKQAWEAIAPLIEREAPRPDDLLRAGIVAFHRQDSEELAASLIERAFQGDPDDPSVRFMRGLVLLGREYEPELAAIEFRAVLAVDPDDAPSLLQLATALDYVDDLEGALEQLEAVRALGMGPNSSFYLQATHRVSRIKIRLARADPELMKEALSLIDEVEELRASNIEAARDMEVWTSTYGGLRLPTPYSIPKGPPGEGRFADFSAQALPATPGTTGLLAVDLDGDERCELIAWGAAGAILLSQAVDGTFNARTIHERSVSFARLGDLDSTDPEKGQYHPAPELLCVEDGVAMLYSYDKQQQAFELIGLGGLEAGDTRAAAFVDLDHEGSLDLVVAGERGLEFRRNHGTTNHLLPNLVRETPEPFLSVGPCRAVLIEDMDGNRAVDLLAVGSAGVVAVAGLWDARFADRTAAWGLAELTVDASRRDGGLLFADVNNDGRPDLVAATRRNLSVLLHDGDRFGAAETVALAGNLPGGLSACDLDRDGNVDLIGRDPTTGALVAIPGPLTGRDGALPVIVLAESSADIDAAVVVSDIDGDGVLDLAVGGPAPQWWRGAAPAGNGITLRLAGRKANTYGVGAIVELRAGSLYRRLFSRGEPLVIGLGSSEAIDVATVRWPDGVVQPVFDLEGNRSHELVQIEGLTGSCPFLYTWNGETYEFITDVLGTAPLGLPMAPGVHVPFDHDEYVRITGEQLVARDGQLELVLTEELREVTYLDLARLHAIDHPADVEVQPDEAFVFPPFPPHHVHTFTDVVAPARVIASNGLDVSAQLAAVDDWHAQPFVHRSAQFRGLTEPWHIDIQLAESDDERAALKAAPRLRLALTGWLLWGDASVNVSAARHPEVSFEPPVLWVPDGDGWRPAGPPIGFIAGKTKTMIVDITDIVDREDPRLRLTTTLALSYDAIRLVLDNDDAPFRDTPLEPSSAEVSWRGFSAPQPDPTGQLGERFDWDKLAPPRWDQHPGMYTRYGDVLELLGSVDDRMVIFGAGDAVTLSFDASQLPPLPAGWTRDYLLYLDGWAKDQDPNTTAARRVEPLPFHGMSDYPPPPGEQFPDTQAHRDWRRLYNTRPGQLLLPDLSAPLSSATVRMAAQMPASGDDD